MKRLLIIFILFTGILAGASVFFLYDTKAKEIHTDLIHTFTEAVEKDRDIRELTIKDTYSFGISRVPSDTSEHKYVTFVNKEGSKTVLRDEPEKENSTNDFMKKMTQSMLYTMTPIKAETLDSVYQSLLIEKEIHLITAVRYTDVFHEKVFWSRPDSVGFVPILEKPMKQGIAAEILLQAYVKPSRIFILSCIHTPFWIIISCWLCISIVLIFLYLNRQYKINKQKQVVHIPQIINTDQELNIDRQLIFDKQTNTLFYKGKTITMRPRAAFLLALLIERLDSSLSNIEFVRIIQEKEGSIIENDSLRKYICQLRNIIKDIQELEIISIPNSGYKLNIKISQDTQNNS